MDPIVNKTYLQIKIEFNKNNIKFSVMNLGKKNNNFIDDIIDDIVIYRISEINKNLFKYAEIQTYMDKKIKKTVEYQKEKDILIIRQIQIPIYLINSIYLE